MLYKKVLFLYLISMGSTIMFFNDITVFGLPFSLITLLIQVAYMIIVLVINPYRQSLRVHSISIIFYQVVYLIFLCVINMINFVSNLSETIILVLGYFITFSCVVLLIVTSIRYYYEYRYG